MVWDASRWLNVIWLALLVIQGLIPAALVYITKWLVDALAAGIGGGVGREDILPILIPAALMGGLMLLQRVLGSLLEWVGVVQGEQVQDHIKYLIHSKAVEVDFGAYESSAYLDLLNQANSRAGSSTLSIQRTLGGLLSSVVTLISIAIILMTYAWWMPFVLFLGTVPSFIILLRHNRRLHRWWLDTTEDRRRTQYFELMVTAPNAAAEVRLYKYGNAFIHAFQTLRARLRGERSDLARRQAIAHLIAGLLGLATTAVMMGWIVWRAMTGLASLGDVALFYQAFNQGYSLLGGILGGFNQIYTNTLFLQQLFEFLDLPRELKETESPVEFPDPIREGIRFEKVSFTYPGTTRRVLRDFELFIPANAIIAVVGENGAGKSTFTKLLCRFYDPDSGQITVDGIDIRRFRIDDLRRNLSIMMQDPTRYQQSVHENITMGDLDLGKDSDRVTSVSIEAGSHEFVESLPRKYQTQLGRWFSTGTELSGGQWRRIALARAFFRRAQLVVLDEPTSFMDSWGELKWMRRFKKLMSDRTALFITHRFTTAMQADTIHVMKEGQIIESGTHHELMSLGGEYAESWNEQIQLDTTTRTADTAPVDPFPFPAPDPVEDNLGLG